MTVSIHAPREGRDCRHHNMFSNNELSVVIRETRPQTKLRKRCQPGKEANVLLNKGFYDARTLGEISDRLRFAESRT